MMILDQRAHLFRKDVGIYLRRGDIRMPQHELHAAQIRPGFQQVAGKGMPQNVR